MTKKGDGLNHRVGEIGFNKQGLRMIIIKYENANNITVKFDDGYIKKTRYSHFIEGAVKNPNCTNRKTHDDFVKRLNAINPNLEVLGEYKGIKKKLLVRCKIDGHEWTPIAGNILKGHGCPECKRRRFIGENNPSYNHNLTDEERENGRTKEHDKWAYDVKIRDNFTCQCCGSNKSGTLVSHHLNGYNWDKEHRYDVDNGITLCIHCHSEFHKIYGYGNNTKEQFDEFLNKYMLKLEL